MDLERRPVAARYETAKGAAAWLRREAPLLVPVVLLPLFIAAGVLYGGEQGFSGVVAVLAPAFFYAGYAVTFVYRLEGRLTRRHARLHEALVRRVDEFSPNEVRLSRHYFETRLAQEIKRSERHNLPLCVITLSTPAERNKAVHTSEVVELATRTLRAEDCAGRLGRNLFAIYLPHTSPAGAAVVIERLRSELNDKQTSFGLAFLAPGSYATPHDLLQAAVADAFDHAA